MPSLNRASMTPVGGFGRAAAPAADPFAPVAAKLIPITALASLALAFGLTWLRPAAPVAPPAAPRVVRSLRFIDGQDGTSIYGGTVRVIDVATGQEYPRLAEKEGFVRVTLNALAYERHKNGLASDLVLDLSGRADGSLHLVDRASGSDINLGAFGAGNRAVFQRFLAPPPGAPR